MGEEPDKLSLEEIDGLTEIWEGFALMDKHEVPKENCQCLQDMKERLRLHYYREIGQGRSPEAVRYLLLNVTNDVDCIPRYKMDEARSTTL